MFVAGGCAVGEAAVGTSLLPGGKMVVSADGGQGLRCWEDVEAAKASGMDEHIAKPLELDRLKEVLMKWL